MMDKFEEDLLMAGKRKQLETFVDLLGRRFPISKTAIRFNECTIRFE